MMTALRKFCCILLVAAAGAVPQTAAANAFVAWKVEGVPFGDVLNVRKYPASTSQKRGAYPEGTQLSMTGRCTGGVDLRALEGAPPSQQKQAVRGQWCEIWHDPSQSGAFEAGWVYGKFISPAH